jgi:gliding motility-associated-like protein
MKKFVIFFTLILLFFSSFSQIHDHFLNADFPDWVGNRELFVVNSNQELQLNATETGSAYLSRPSPQFYDVWEWIFYIRLPFSPSNNNFARIYLTANTTDFTSLSLQGYYLQFGENLSLDAIELFYQNGDLHTSICRGKEARIATSFSLNVKVRYTEPSHWEILVDEYQSGIYETEGLGVSTAQFEHAAFGVYCKYTASNSKKFFFDDFYYGPPIIDTIKPNVIALYPQQDNKTLQVQFSENVTPGTALMASNYVIDEIIRPEGCDFVALDFSKVEIYFKDELKDRTTHTIQIENVYDVSGNKMEKFQGNFCFAKIHRNDILITEIMASPHPIVGLPDCEYIELHNSGVPDTVILRNWRLRINNSYKNLPEIRIPPNGYVFLVANSCTGYDDNPQGNMYSISSLGIAAEGAQIVLYNAINEVIHEIAFSNTWHRNKQKSAGGWSLEMIDPKNPCTGENNWDSSISNSGGTPGKQNSICKPNPDNISPEIEKITIVDSIHLRLFFTETIFFDSLKTFQLFEINKNVKIVSVSEVAPNNRILQIQLQNAIQPNVLYTLTLKDTIRDCAQNPIVCNKSYRFALPNITQPSDIVINEVLFNAKDNTKAEFVELYNRSQKVIDLATLRIGCGGDELPDKSVIAVSSGFLLFPNEYVALCKHKTITETQYYVPYPNRLIQCDSLPSYNNNAGVVFLSDKSFNTIDRFQYTDKMHYPLLAYVSGVSLERVNFNRETQNENNWKSAAESCGFATPGYQNSHFLEDNNFKDILKVVPEVFSPNQSGYADYVEIHCTFEDSENRVSITIFDRYGNLITTIANNKICAQHEVFLWNGISNKNYRVPQDLYVVKMEYWNLNTKRKSILKTVGVMY